jgi:hypothetical protein
MHVRWLVICAMFALASLMEGVNAASLSDDNARLENASRDSSSSVHSIERRQLLSNFNRMFVYVRHLHANGCCGCLNTRLVAGGLFCTHY